LVEASDLAYISTGDLFRKHLGEGTPLGLKAKGYMEQGELVPDEITTAMVLEQLATFGEEKSCLLDGYPRNLSQAQALDEALAKQGKGVGKVLSIAVAEEELVRRLSGRLICRNCQAPYHVDFSPPKVEGLCNQCGGEVYRRKDDSPEVVRQRIKVYAAQTEPLIGYYQQKGILVEINGVGNVEAIQKQLQQAMEDVG
jgi:adenylate kinase